MSLTIVFIVGVVVFAITVYGTVMAGGLALTQRHLEADDSSPEPVEDGVLGTGVPFGSY